MTRGRLFILLVVFALGISLLASGTFGFSKTEVDRGLTGTIADDDSAYVGLQQEVTAENNSANVTLTVSNNNPQATITEITVYEDGSQLNGTTTSLEAGEQTPFHIANIDCGTKLRIEVVGSERATTLWRTVECP